MKMNDEDLKGLAAREAVLIDKDKSKTRRACKYNQIRVHNICTHISNGNTFRASALAEGISEATFHRWRKEHEEFDELVEEAIGISEAKLVNKLAQSEDWRAAAWILERRFPQSWTKKDHIDMHVSRSEGLDEIKAMIQQTDHILDVDRSDVNQDS
tara:strand:- start:458 stop:925 length:468 start_codon:yes stop_codon:yes gene_type:complete